VASFILKKPLEEIKLEKLFATCSKFFGTQFYVVVCHHLFLINQSRCEEVIGAKIRSNSIIRYKGKDHLLKYFFNQ